MKPTCMKTAPLRSFRILSEPGSSISILGQPRRISPIMGTPGSSCGCSTRCIFRITLTCSLGITRGECGRCRYIMPWPGSHGGEGLQLLDVDFLERVREERQTSPFTTGISERGIEPYFMVLITPF